MDARSAGSASVALFPKIQPDSGALVNGQDSRQRSLQRSPQPGTLAALAFHDLVALFQQALAFAILAGLLLLDVRAFCASHAILPSSNASARSSDINLDPINGIRDTAKTN
jgi:hypothetical protein